MGKKLSLFMALALTVLSLPVQADYKDVIIADSPEAYYRFEDPNAGNGCEDTMGNHPAGYLGYITLTPNGWDPSLGKAATFYGTSNGSAVSVSGGNTSGLELTTMSIEFLISAPLGTDYNRIFQHNDGSTAGPGIFEGLGSGEQIGVEGANSTWYTPYSGTDVFDQGWHQVVVSWAANVDSNTVETWYVDGALAASRVTAGLLDYSGLQSWSSPIIGSNGNPGYLYNGFVGTLDEVSIYDYELSAAQVLDHYLAIPEPMTITLLGLGGLLMRRRKQ